MGLYFNRRVCKRNIVLRNMFLRMHWNSASIQFYLSLRSTISTEIIPDLCVYMNIFSNAGKHHFTRNINPITHNQKAFGECLDIWSSIISTFCVWPVHLTLHITPVGMEDVLRRIFLLFYNS